MHPARSYVYPLTSHSPVSGRPRVVRMCLCLEFFEDQLHPNGISGVCITTMLCKGLYTDREPISVLFYCQTTWVIAWVSFSRLKRSFNKEYHLIRNTHINILSSTYRPLCPSMKLLLWCHNHKMESIAPFILLTSPKQQN